jgi:hypothetical protein
MSTDFRLASDFLRHHKVQRLRARLGADGVLAWLGLIGYTAANKPDGRLTGLIPEDIAAVAEWRGEQDLVATLVDLHLLDRRGKLYTMHNWSTRQPWLTASEKRWQKARKAAQVRWSKPKRSTQSTVISDSASDATSIATSNATSTAQSNAPILTSPNLTQPKKRSSVANAPGCESFQRFWNSYPRKTAKLNAQRAWGTLNPDTALTEKLITDVGTRWVGYQKAAIPHAATYLNGARWEDEIVPPLTNGGSNGRVAPPRQFLPTLEDLEARDRAQAV